MAIVRSNERHPLVEKYDRSFLLTTKFGIIEQSLYNSNSNRNKASMHIAFDHTY